MEHVFVFGDCDDDCPQGEPISTAVAVGPRLILTCAHCLTKVKSGRKLTYNEEYWVQPSVKLETSGTWSNTGRILVTLFKYHVENDWALLTRNDGGVFDYFSSIDMQACELGNSFPDVQTVDVLHCPVKLLVANFDEYVGEYTLKCNCLLSNAVRIQSSHHLYYNNNNSITRGSSGGAVHIAGSHLLFALHCERVGEVEFDAEQCEKFQDVKGKRVESEAFTYEEVQKLKKPKCTKTSCDSESIARSFDSCKEGLGKAIVISKYPRLIHYIQEINTKT